MANRVAKPDDSRRSGHHSLDVLPALHVLVSFLIVLDEGEDLFLKTWTIPQLRKGSIAQLKGKIRNFSPSSDQFLVVRLDADDEIGEVDETNNVVSRQIPALADP